MLLLLFYLCIYYIILARSQNFREISHTENNGYLSPPFQMVSHGQYIQQSQLQAAQMQNTPHLLQIQSGQMAHSGHMQQSGHMSQSTHMSQSAHMTNSGGAGAPGGPYANPLQPHHPVFPGYPPSVG